MPTQNTSSTGWDQTSFENMDRRHSRKELAAGPEKLHDFLHLECEPATGEHVHAILREHTRQTDCVHTHGDAVILNCSPGDAEGLRAKLEPHFKAKSLAVRMSHNTFAAGSELDQSLASLKGG